MTTPLVLHSSNTPQRAAPAAEPALVQPGDIMRVLRRRIWLIAVCAVLAVITTAYFLAGATPRYVAYSQMLLGEQGLADRSTFDLTEAQALTSSIIEGELAVLRSNAVLVRVAEKLNLEELPEFNSELRPPASRIPVLSDLRDFARSLLPAAPVPERTEGEEGEVNPLDLAANAGDSQLGDLQDAVDTLRESIRVRQQGTSFVVQVLVETENAQTSAAIANALMDEYIRFLTDKRFQAAQRFTTWLETRVADLAIKLEASEKDALAFRATMDADADSSERLDQQMRELTSKLVNARSELAEAIALSDKVKEIAERDGPLAAADILTSDEVLEYRGELGQLRRREAGEVINYGENSVQVNSIRRAVAKIEESITIEVQRSIEQLTNRAEVLKIVVDSLEGGLRALENLALERSSDQIQLNQLQRIADANQRVYQEFLGRFKETSEIQNLQTSDAEVISYASPPNAAAYPRKKLGVALAGAAGIFGGIALAFLAELKPVRLTSTTQLTNATGLGVYGRADRTVARATGSETVRKLRAGQETAFKQNARRLASNVDLRAGGHAQSVLVGSAHQGSGKYNVALMLGWAAAQKDRKCIVVDVDIRDAGLSRALGADRKEGNLVSVLYGEKTLEDSVVGIEDLGIDFLPTTRIGSDPAVIFDTDRANQIAAMLLKEYDVVIFDAPISGKASDGIILRDKLDVGLFIVAAGKLTDQEARDGLAVFEQSRANNFGAVLTGASEQAT